MIKSRTAKDGSLLVTKSKGAKEYTVRVIGFSSKSISSFQRDMKELYESKERGIKLAKTTH